MTLLADIELAHVSSTPSRRVHRALTSIRSTSESSDLLQGEIFALVDYNYDDVRHVLVQAEHWCGILILHLNVKYCRRASPGRTP
jgi:hypothetical protein